MSVILMESQWWQLVAALLYVILIPTLDSFRGLCGWRWVPRYPCRDAFIFVCVCWSVDLCPVCPSFLPSSSMCSRVRRLGDGYWSCFGRRLCCNMNMNPFHHGLLHFSSWSRSISIHVIYAVRSMPTFTISFSNAKVLICHGSEQNSWKLGRLQARIEQYWKGISTVFLSVCIFVFPVLKSPWFPWFLLVCLLLGSFW